jgi:hypothetical protein
MAYNTFTQSFGAAFANQPVHIFETSSGISAIVLSSTTGGILNDQGYAVLDGSGDLSVIINTAKTWTVTALNPSDVGSASLVGVTPGELVALSAMNTAGLGTSPKPTNLNTLGSNTNTTALTTAITAGLGQDLWDDLRFPAQGINPAGAAAPPSVDDVLTSYPGTLLFSGSAENVIAGVAQMPHAWKEGTAIKPHIHWSKPVGSANATDWVLYYRILGSPGDAPGNWVGPVAGTIAAGSPTVSNEMVITSFGPITMTGKKGSCVICWNVRRLGNTDADSGTARFYEFDIHYQIDKFGSIPEFPV